MSQNLGSPPLVTQCHTFSTPSSPLKCDVIYGCPLSWLTSHSGQVVRNPDRSWWHLHTSLKLFWPQTMAPCTPTSLFYVNILYRPTVLYDVACLYYQTLERTYLTSSIIWRAFCGRCPTVWNTIICNPGVTYITVAVKGQLTTSPSTHWCCH